MTPKWTYLTPTVQGIYFVHRNGGTAVAYIRPCFGSEGPGWTMQFTEGIESKDFRGCRFYGPIVAPPYDCLHEERDHGICCDCGKQCDSNAPDYEDGSDDLDEAYDEDSMPHLGDRP